MVERPILFSGPMVRAIMRLVDPKTETRRVIMLRDFMESTCQGFDFDFRDRRGQWNSVMEADVLARCPWRVEDLLYVREAHWQDWTGHINVHGEFEAERWSRQVRYVADYPDGEKPEHGNSGFWRKMPSIFMPKWASRIWLRVLEVRVERLQEITPQGILAEGVTLEAPQAPGVPDYTLAWRTLWDSINTKRGFGWEARPWVWVVRFEMVSTTGRPN